MNFLKNKLHIILLLELYTNVFVVLNANFSSTETPFDKLLCIHFLFVKGYVSEKSLTLDDVELVIYENTSDSLSKETNGCDLLSINVSELIHSNSALSVMFFR